MALGRSLCQQSACRRNPNRPRKREETLSSVSRRAGAAAPHRGAHRATAEHQHQLRENARRAEVEGLVQKRRWAVAPAPAAPPMASFARELRPRSYAKWASPLIVHACRAKRTGKGPQRMQQPSCKILISHRAPRHAAHHQPAKQPAKQQRRRQPAMSSCDGAADAFAGVRERYDRPAPPCPYICMSTLSRSRCAPPALSNPWSHRR
jgi:hypothetical protein